MRPRPLQLWKAVLLPASIGKMKTLIADIITEVPAAGGLAARCRDYVYNGEEGADVIIRTDLYSKNRYPVEFEEDTLAYMESAYQFYSELIKFGGFYLHASAVSYQNKAYLFSGPCGTGKSTHTGIWKTQFGEDVQIFNDDKPALRCIDGTWYAYGTPWCGKDGININMKVPLAGICFLKQAPENAIRRLDNTEAIQKILSQTIRKFHDIKQFDQLLHSIDSIVRTIPVFELENRPEPEAARLSYETMRRAAEELGL